MSELDVPPLPPEEAFIDSVPIGGKLPYMCLPDLALLSYVRQLHDGPHHLVFVPCDASLLVGGHAPAASIGPCLRHYRSTVRALMM